MLPEGLTSSPHLHLLSSAPSGLLHHDINLIAVLHLERVRRVIIFDALTIKNEPALIVGKALSLAVGIHQLFQLRRSLDFKEDLSAVLRLDFDVDVLLFLLISSLLPCNCTALLGISFGGRCCLIFVGHFLIGLCYCTDVSSSL